MNCYEKVDPEKASKMSSSERANICAAEQQRVKEVIMSDKLKMATLLAQRSELLDYWEDHGFPKGSSQFGSAYDML